MTGTAVPGRPPFVGRRGRRWLSTLALLALAVAWAALMQQPGPNQNAHLATVTALSRGESTIDRYRTWSRDISWIDGHFYSAKSPGMDILTLPWYVALDRTGLLVEGPPSTVPWPEAELTMPPAAPWQVGLFGATLPALLLLLLVRSVVERFVPGFGTAAAVIVGAGSLVGVLATLYFSHALSAFLAFATFTILVRERAGPPDLRLVAAAGALAGLAVAVELPVAIAGALLAVYALARAGQHRLRRGLAYAVGGVIGVLPLLAFNTWALGSPFSLAYTNAVIEPGKTGHDVLGANSSGFFGLGLPSPYAAAELLVWAKGIAVLSPVWILALAGLWLLWRQGHRAEAALIGAMTGAYLVYDAAYYLPFGGFNGGPRFLVPLFPFLALPLAAVLRARPLTTWALAGASIVVTSVSLVAGPMFAASDVAVWFRRLQIGRDDAGWVTRTVLHRVDALSASQQVLLVLLVIALAVLLAVLVTPRPALVRRDALLALTALVYWRAIYVGGPIMFRVDEAEGDWVGAAAATALLLTAILALILMARGVRAAVPPTILVLVFAWPRFASHTTIALAFALCLVAWLLALIERERRRAAGETSVPSPA